MAGDESRSSRALIVVDSQGNYFWASRGMRPLVRQQSGIYVTYTASAGYIKTYDDEALEAIRKGEFPLMDPWPEYVEHLHLGLGSITYYGVRDDG